MEIPANYIKRIEIHGLWQRYNIVWNLEPDVNILSGINGGGKSTILNRSVNYLEQTSGKVKSDEKQGVKVIFDNNYRPRLWASKEETQQVYQQMLECTDIAFLTLDDEDALWGQQPVEDVIARTHNAGVKEVVVKRGADSCLVSIAGEGLVDVPAVKLPKEKVIDTTAAGDSFSAGYLAVRLTGGSAENAAKRGHLTASTVIQYRGAIIPREAMPA